MGRDFGGRGRGRGPGFDRGIDRKPGLVEDDFWLKGAGDADLDLGLFCIIFAPRSV